MTKRVAFLPWLAATVGMLVGGPTIIGWHTTVPSHYDLTLHADSYMSARGVAIAMGIAVVVLGVAPFLPTKKNQRQWERSATPWILVGAAVLVFAVATMMFARPAHRDLSSGVLVLAGALAAIATSATLVVARTARA